MPDLDHLHAAFGELERRADAAPDVVAAPRPVTQRTRWGLVAASAVAVLAVAGGALALVGSGNDGTPAAGPASPTVSAPPAPTTAPPATSASRQPERRLPSSGQEMAARLQEVLGATGRVTSFQTFDGGNYIVGRISTDAGRGSFDIQVVDGAGGDPMCADPDRMVCTIHRLPDGSKYAFGREESQLRAGGILYLLNLVRKDGTNFLFHVSNEGDPKGGSGVLGDAPPLTRQQMLAVVRSETWGS